MIEVGRVCLKIAGRDANQKCVIVSVVDNNYVVVDGQTRRKRCNILHLEPLPQFVEIVENASHDYVVKALAAINVVCLEKKGKKEAKKRPIQKRKSFMKGKSPRTAAPKKVKPKKEEKKEVKKNFE